MACQLSAPLSAAESLRYFDCMLMEACCPFVLCKMQKFTLAGHCCSCYYFSAGDGSQGKASRASQRLRYQCAALSGCHGSLL